MALGQVDYHLYKPWHPLERILYPAVSEFLAAWDKSQEAQVVPVRIVGAESSARSHELRDTLTRVGVPYWFYDHDSTAGIELLAAAGVDRSRLPVVAFYDGTVLVDPALPEIWQALGVRTRIDVKSCDLVVIGAGPAGLASAVYAASEGLETLVLESAVPGGQAGTSSLIRNYLGFHRGISGDDLTNRAVEQAWLFGTRFVLSQAAVRLGTRSRLQLVTTSDGSEVTARAVVIATGVTWRRLDIPELDALVGAGVFYGAAGAEAKAMQGRDVFVVGAGNSAGQAAMHLARYAASVTMLVRGETLRATMSEYLVSEIEQAPNIHLRLGTEVVGGAGAGRLEGITLRGPAGAGTEVVAASALFLLIGAEPRTAWLNDSVARDDHGFVLTGRDLFTNGEASPSWTLRRPPMLLETSMPGVFAAGDVRHRSIKRVAAAVGEGSTAIQLIHEYLSDPEGLDTR
ncbi:FAD-dependent oxidoreductase [Kribbella sp. NPDC023972]|uniref:FAD-dependent oxidoreductase n=1 Tax=Kribbella sp. NPDC023972 TaxID=3154795 RepID=UPI0033C0458A